MTSYYPGHGCYSVTCKTQNHSNYDITQSNYPETVSANDKTLLSLIACWFCYKK